METEAPCPQFRSVHKAYLTCAAPCVKLHAVFAPLRLKSNNQLGIVYKLTRSQCAHRLGEFSKGQETRTLVPEELQVQPQQMQPERILRPTSSHIFATCWKLHEAPICTKLRQQAFASKYQTHFHNLRSD